MHDLTYSRAHRLTFASSYGPTATSVVLVRLFLFLALAAIAVSGVLYLVKKDRRYLRFIGQVLKYTIFLLVGVLLFFAFKRLMILV